MNKLRSLFLALFFMMLIQPLHAHEIRPALLQIVEAEQGFIHVTLKVPALGDRMIGSPVWGFLPLLSPFSFTENFPKPLMRTSSPFSSGCLINSNRESTTLRECFLVYPTWLLMTFAMSALVSVIAGPILRSALVR